MWENIPKNKTKQASSDKRPHSAAVWYEQTIVLRVPCVALRQIRKGQVYRARGKQVQTLADVPIEELGEWTQPCSGMITLAQGERWGCD